MPALLSTCGSNEPGRVNIRKFTLIEHDLDDDGRDIVSEQEFTHEALMSRFYDEHYSEGICLVFAVVPADNAGNFGDLHKLRAAILDRVRSAT